MIKRNDRINETAINNQGLEMIISDYKTISDITVSFTDGTQVKTTYQHFKQGSVRNPNFKIPNVRNETFYKDRIGKTNINNQNCKMTIIKYEDSNNIIVEFDDPFHTQKKTTWRRFETGAIKNPNLPTVCGVGIVSDRIPIMDGNKKIKEYTIWSGIINRCTKDNSSNRSKTYASCSVCDEWLFFPNFYQWITAQSNYEKWKNNTGWHLDKDIIIKGNKVYSPETCCLVPHYINTIFKSTKVRRGKLPIGVSKDRNGKYFAQCGNPFTGANDHLGTYDSIEEAFTAYKVHREMLIKQLAQREFDSGNISKECYIAMSNYQVEITD